MGQVTVVARIKAKPDVVDRVRGELLKLLAPTRAEQGCINYDMHQDNDDPSLFIFHENWESNDLLDRHLASAHLRAYMAAVEGLVEAFEVRRLTKLG